MPGIFSITTQWLNAELSLCHLCVKQHTNESELWFWNGTVWPPVEWLRKGQTCCSRPCLQQANTHARAVTPDTRKQRWVKLHVFLPLFTNTIQTDKESVETNHLALVTESSPYLHHGFYDFLGGHERLNFACAWLHTHTPLMGDDRNNRHNSSTKELHRHWHHRGNVWNLFSALTQSSSGGSIFWVNSSWRKKMKEKREKKWKNVSTPMTVLWESTKRNTCRKIAAKMHKSVGKSHIIWSFIRWETKYYPKREWSRFNVTGWGRGVGGGEREKRPTDKKVDFYSAEISSQNSRHDVTTCHFH